ncbi:anthranilate synthase component I [Enterococcus sp. 8G7_MSG3316]|uniref:Anthranilate synthase component 1 n=1 Tax=Candidatus Enterococcus testudinis TaxID=1834191 RepID=A0A242A5V3_9ENTE|nr:anthranilate synthase component I [Enterococcus sp. 8G7_MSG3316]OTN76415.1 anthranilate synthase component I [Enterococcus sp. 8G7_MSG3316]
MYMTTKITSDCLTPVSVFLRIQGRSTCLLESIPREEDTGRYSIIAFDPVAKLTYQEGIFTRFDFLTGKTVETPCTDPLKEMEQHVLRALPSIPNLPLQSGAIGYAGYDIAACYEDIGKIPYDELQIPDLAFLLFETFIVIDHQQETLSLIVENCYSQRSEAEMTAIFEKTKARLTVLSPLENYPPVDEHLSFTSNMTQQTYEAVVAQAKELIKAGDLFQVVPSQRLKAPFAQAPFDYYRKLRVTNPSAYLYYLDLTDDFKVIGSSPESLIRVNGENIITNPIAGTRKRGQTKQEDEALAEELLADEKERAEHLMLIDLGRNDLGKIAEIGSVTVPLCMVVEKYRYVMHIVSVVTARRRKQITAMDALRATLPAGTVSGAPKIRAMTRIYQWESVRRGVYAGAVGYFSRNDQADFAIGIRTMVVKDGYGYVQAGAGVVYDSEPVLEYQETLHKAKALLEVAAK